MTETLPELFAPHRLVSQMYFTVTPIPKGETDMTQPIHFEVLADRWGIRTHAVSPPNDGLTK